MNSTAQKKDTDRIWFAHMLRAVAVIAVMISHYVDVFAHANAVAVGLAFTRPVTVDPGLLLPKIILWFYNFNFNAGPFGVAVFFLISGFVIPISMEHIGTGQFIIRRFFRIFPPYAVGLLLVVIVMYVYTSRIGTPFPYTARDYLINASLLRDWFWIPSIDGVNWTLEVELKFYILCTFLAWVSNLKSSKTLIVTTMVMLIFVYVTSGTYDFLLNNFFYLYKFAFNLSSAFGYIVFMFIGTCFYNLHTKHWTFSRFLVTAAVLFTFFYIAVSFSPVQALVSPIHYNYFYALVLFSLCYRFKDKIPYSRVLDFLSNISYPIYIVHGATGYILLTVFVTHNVHFYVSLVAVAALIIIESYILHRFVELPSNRLGKQISKWVKSLLADKPASVSSS